MTNPGMVRLICPNLKCRTILCAPGHARGKMVRCSACGCKVRIPEQNKPAAPAPAPADQAEPTAS